MSSQFSWWGEVKDVIRRSYTDEGTEEEKKAVLDAITETATLKNGDIRTKMVDIVFRKKSHNLAGAALQLYVCERTVEGWHSEFVRLVAKNLGYMN